MTNETKRSRRLLAGTAAIAAIGLAGAGIATASAGSGGPERASGPEGAAEEAIHAPDSSGSRLDDGADRLPEATISEADAVSAAQKAASGPLSEVDLEDYDGRLVFNVDVGSHDVKVDAATGEVLAAPQDE